LFFYQVIFHCGLRIYWGLRGLGNKRLEVGCSIQ
jgi:hypothetical protein